MFDLPPAMLTYAREPSIDADPGSRHRPRRTDQARSSMSPMCWPIRSYKSEPAARSRSSNSLAFAPCWRADAQGRRPDRRHHHLSPGGAPVHRQADRAGARTSPRRRSSPSRTRGCSRCTSARRSAESLEQQTATGEILAVISRRRPIAKPVFDDARRMRARICDAQFGVVSWFDGDTDSARCNPWRDAARRPRFVQAA